MQPNGVGLGGGSDAGTHGYANYHSSEAKTSNRMIEFKFDDDGAQLVHILYNEHQTERVYSPHQAYVLIPLRVARPFLTCVYACACDKRMRCRHAIQDTAHQLSVLDGSVRSEKEFDLITLPSWRPFYIRPAGL